MRIKQHPILEIDQNRKPVTIYVDGKPVACLAGEPVAAALTAAGIRTFRYTHKHQEPRGLFCGIGQCTDCVMEINGIPNVRTCVTLVEEGMEVRTQYGHGQVGQLLDGPSEAE